MRHPWAIAGLSGLVLATGAAALAAGPSIRAARWVASSADPVAVLTRSPVECLRKPRGAEAAYEVEVGRAAFRTPLLLGGQASRAGLDCESCHRNGRTNPSFFFPGLSGAPGTADVTSSLFSSHRGDGIDNPKPIPDLGGDKARLKIGQANGDPALPLFIHGLITEEFDGAEPTPGVLKGLAAYVRALAPSACAARETEPVRVEQPISDARRAVQVAIAALDRNDDETAILMVESARSQLALIDERYGAIPRDRAGVRVAALDLSAAVADVRARRKPDARTALIAWLVRTPTWARPVEADQARSLYNPTELARSLRSAGQALAARH
ncbi:hypothetical protein [Caulobacter sp. S45]|uniref:hypothetical protein n=1 Tax=Caulobacter sp. S45 TaxID=1641861 RepID=UPI00131E4260|nr:hypothetical protein [Caulobacter sp. S45]